MQGLNQRTSDPVASMLTTGPRGEHSDDDHDDDCKYFLRRRALRNHYFNIGKTGLSEAPYTGLITRSEDDAAVTVG